MFYEAVEIRGLSVRWRIEHNADLSDKVKVLVSGFAFAPIRPRYVSFPKGRLVNFFLSNKKNAYSSGIKRPPGETGTPR